MARLPPLRNAQAARFLAPAPDSVVGTLEPGAGIKPAAGCYLPAGLTLKGQEQFELG